VTLKDSGAINDFNEGFLPGNLLSFHVVMTTNPDTSAADRFSFSLLDANGDPIATNDPTNVPLNPEYALLYVDITGPAPSTSRVFHSTTTAAPQLGPPSVTVATVPGPPGLVLLALGLGGVLGPRRPLRRRDPSPPA
jgi:hypothetical protein